jgi:nitrogen fixation protein FixH
MVFGLLGLNVAVVGVTLYLAHSDASFAVEPDYYQKAVEWDESARARAASDRLGWTGSLEVSPGSAAPPFVTVRLIDRAGAPVADAHVQAAAFASARAAERRLLTLPQTQPGIYAAAMPDARPGQWEFRISATRGSERFQTSVERTVPAAAEASP